MIERINYSKPESIKFNSFTIKSFQPDTQSFTAKNKVLRYHYTSANALISILKNHNQSASVRFTDVRYLNDKSEMLYFVKCLIMFLRDNRKDYPFCQEIVNEWLLKEHSEDEYIAMSVSKITPPPFRGAYYAAPIRTFVFCTCKAPDSLHMWNYYIHNGDYQGYNIGFDIYKFLKSFDTKTSDPIDPISFVYGDVLYTKRDQEKEITALCDKLEKNKKSPDQVFAFDHAMYELYSYIYSHGVFFKDIAFKEEEEYRVVIELMESRINNDKVHYSNKNNKNIKLDFYERNGILVPCLSVPFEIDAINKITMAPMMEYDIAKESIEEFLKVNGYENVEVIKSEVPIRY